MREREKEKNKTVFFNVTHISAALKYRKYMNEAIGNAKRILMICVCAN